MTTTPIAKDSADVFGYTTAFDQALKKIGQISPQEFAIGNLTNLTSLDLEYNQLTSPPTEIAYQGTQAVLAYLREQLAR